MEACAWPVLYLGCDSATPVPSPLNELSDEVRAHFEQQAIDLLWNWTNRRFGVCEISIRPCLDERCTLGRSSTFGGRGPFTSLATSQRWSSVMIDGRWYFVGCGICREDCSCGDCGPTVLRIPGPVVSITRITIDGLVLDPSAYRVADGLLYRLDGNGWPTSQNLSRATSEIDTFEIVYKRGVEVPTGGQAAAGRLALEFAKAACNDSSCELPQRIQTITRQGVTVGFTDQFEGLADRRVGIWEIDAWVASVNTPAPVATVRSVDRR